MRKSKYILFLLLVSFTSLEPFTAFSKELTQEDTNREIVQTYVKHFIEQGRFQRAERKLNHHLREDPRDSGAWNTLGLLSLRMRKLRPAEEAFKNAVANSDDELKGRYHYNYADVLNRRGKTAAAKVNLSKSKKYNSTSIAANQALRELKPRRSLPTLRAQSRQFGLKGWTLKMGLQGGYDSNVLLLSDTTLALIAASSTESPVYKFSGSGGYQFSAMTGVARIKGGLNFTWHTQNPAGSFNILSNSLALQWDKKLSKNLKLALRNLNSVSFLNQSPFGYYNYVNTTTATTTYKYHRKASLELEALGKYQDFDTSSATTSANDRTGFGYGGRITNNFSFFKARISHGGRFQKINTKGSNFDTHTYQAPLQISHPLPERFIARISFTYTHTRYIKPSINRIDNNYNGKAAVGKKLSKNWIALFQYGYLKNTSKVASAKYKKHTGSLLLSYDFF